MVKSLSCSSGIFCRGFNSVYSGVLVSPDRGSIGRISYRSPSSWRAQCARTVRVVPTPQRMRFSDMSPSLHSGPQVKLVCPAVFALAVREPVCLGDRRRLGQTVGGNVVRFDSGCGFHASMDRLAVDTAVDQQVHNVDVFGTKLPCHGLRHRAQAKLGRSERSESFTAANTGRRPCKQDCPAAATSHVLCGFAAHEKSSITRKLPGFKEQLLGGFQQRLVHIRTGVEKTDFDGTHIFLDLGKQLLDFLFLARIDAKGVKLGAPGLQLLGKRLGFFGVAPGDANFVSALGKASCNSRADGIAGSNQKSNSV